MNQQPSANPNDLLAHAGWLRRLAHHLVRDGQVAQDAVQEVWERAHRSPPTAGRPPRPWLAEVLRNIVRMQVRGDRRREHHQARAAREAPRSTESAESSYERLEMHRAVVEIVMALDEPLRAAVLLHYFEEHSSAEIARKTGVPAGTVRWRLASAVEKIRVELDRRFGGDRRRWAVALAPLGKGALIVMAKSKATVAVAVVVSLLVLGGGAWLIRDRWVRATDLASDGDHRRHGGRSGWVLPPDDTRGTGEVAGTVLAPDGTPVPGAAVTLIRPTAENDRQPPAVVASATSDPRGRFRLTGLAPGTYQAAAMADGFAPGRRSGIAVAARATTQVEVRLEAGGLSLRGRVMDVGGGPVARAMVVAVVSFSGPEGRASAHVLHALTDDGGAYRLATRAGTHRLRVEAAGYAPAEAFLLLQDNRSRDFQLAPSARVSGRVLARGSRQPVADAEVLLVNDDDAGPAPVERDPVRTDADGRFAFTNVQPGRHALAARKAALAGAALPLTVNAAEQVERELLIDPAAAVSGRVVDQTGAPVAAALVQLARGMFGGGREPSLKTRADAAGRFRLEGVLPGLYTVRAQEDATTSLDGTGVAVGQKDVEGIEVQLERLARIAGEAITAEGKPAVNLEVDVMASVHRPNRMMTVSRPAVTDERGRFERLVQGGRITVSATDPALGQVREVLGEVAPGETRRVTLRLRPGGQARIAGQVRYEGGGPAAGLVVQAHGGRSTARARTDGEGRFTLVGLDGGPTTLMASAEEDARHLGPWNRAELELTLEPGEHRQPVMLTLPARGRITGRVLGPDGQPAVGVTVIGAVEHGGRASTGGARRTSSQGDGGFVLDDLPRRPHTVWAIHDAYPDAELTGVATGGSDVVLRFRPGGRVSGQVVSPAGEPVPDFFISAQPRAATTRRGAAARQVREPSGAFTVARLPAGTYTVEARTAAGERAEAQVTLAEGEVKEGLRLVLEAATSVAGRVVDFDTGAPVRGAEVQSSVALGVVSTRTDESGAFQLDRVPRGGRPRLAWGAAGYYTDGLTIQHQAGPAGDRSEPLLLKLMKGSEASKPQGRPRGTHGLAVQSSGRIATVRGVTPETPAAQAGILAGDQLVAIDGKTLDGLGEGGVNRLLGRDPGAAVALVVRTGAAPPRQVNLTLAAPAPPPSR